MLGSSVLARDDTMFGICQALGEDFGFDPFLIRMLLGVGLLFSPLATLALYAGLGIIVAISRWIVAEPALPDAVEAFADEGQESRFSVEELALAA